MPLSVLLVEGVECGAVLRLAVEVVVAAEPRLLGGGQERERERRHPPRVGHVLRPAGAVERGRPPLVVLGLLEPGQDPGPAPARVPERLPRVEVRGVPPHVHGRGDAAAAAPDPAPGPGNAAPVEVGLLLGRELPVEVRARQLAVRARLVDARVGVGTSGLEDEHGHRGVLAQAARDDAPGGARADDHVVVRRRLLGRPGRGKRQGHGHEGSGEGIGERRHRRLHVRTG